MLFDQHTDGSDTMFARAGKYKSAHGIIWKWIARGGRVLIASYAGAMSAELISHRFHRCLKPCAQQNMKIRGAIWKCKSRLGRILNTRCISVCDIGWYGRALRISHSLHESPALIKNDRALPSVFAARVRFLYYFPFYERRERRERRFKRCVFAR